MPKKGNYDFLSHSSDFFSCNSDFIHAIEKSHISEKTVIIASFISRNSEGKKKSELQDVNSQFREKVRIV